MRLAPKQDLRAEEGEAALADPGVDDGDAAFEVLLAPGPAAPEGLPGVEPADAAEALRLGPFAQLEGRARGEHDVDFVGRHPPGQGVGAVEADPEDGGGDVELLGG